MMRVTCLCGKSCENLEGLKIHQTKMGYTRRKQADQHAEAVLSTVPGEREPPYSVQNLQAQCAASRKPSKHCRVLMRQFDEDINAALEASSKGAVDQQLHVHLFYLRRCWAIWHQKAKSQITAKANRRENKVTQLRKDLRTLTQWYKRTRNEERPALSDLWDILRKKFISLHRAEWHRRKRRERARKRTAFIVNPFGFTKKLLGKKRSGTFTCPVLHHLTAQCRGQNVFQDSCQLADRVPSEEFLHWHHCAEGGSSRHSRLHRTYRSCHPVNPRGKGKPRRVLVIWLDLANAYGSIPHKLVAKALTTHHVPQKVTELIQQFQHEIHLWSNNIGMVLPRERHRHWLHHISDAVLPGDDYARQGSRSGI